MAAPEVGESATNQDTFITVSGLKPDHFYNVRIIAVGSNNFQAGSRVLRLRTFGEDGRPRLDTGRLPPAPSQEDLLPRQPDGQDESGASGKPLVATFGAVAAQDAAPSLAREGSSATGSAAAPRRNTVGRRHSPSTASLDKQQSAQEEPSDASADKMAELNQRYLNLRRDTEEAQAQIAKEDDDTMALVQKLESDKQEKRREQKAKEEQTEKLRREQGTTDRAMRIALQRKSQKEKLLREKKAELAKLHEGMVKWQKGIEDMKKEQVNYTKQKTEIEGERDGKVQSLREASAGVQKDCSRMEAELKEKRQQVKELEDARKELSWTEEDAEWQDKMLELQRDLQRKDILYRTELEQLLRRQQGLDRHIHILTNQLQQIPQSSYGLFNRASSSAFDFDNSPQGQIKRRSRNSNSLSNVTIPSPPAQLYPMAMEPPGSAAGLGAHSRTSLPPRLRRRPVHGPQLRRGAGLGRGRPARPDGGRAAEPRLRPRCCRPTSLPTMSPPARRRACRDSAPSGRRTRPLQKTIRNPRRV